MSGFDWKGTVGKVAPVLAGILGSPAAGVAVSGLCKLLGLEPTPENAEKAAEQIAMGQLTGEQLIQLKKVEADSILALKKAGLDYDIQTEQIVMADRASARNRQIQLRDTTPTVLAYLITAGFFGILGGIMKWGMPGSETAKDALLMMLGALAAAFNHGVVGYFFGSSAGSDKKTEIMGSK